VEPIAAAAIAAISAIVGGIIGGLLRPWGQDWVARRAEEREGERARHQRRTMQLDRAGDMLLAAPSDGGARQALPTVLGEIGDGVLTELVEQMLSSGEDRTRFFTLRTQAQRRVGELLGRGRS